MNLGTPMTYDLQLLYEFELPESDYLLSVPTLDVLFLERRVAPPFA